MTSGVVPEVVRNLMRTVGPTVPYERVLSVLREEGWSLPREDYEAAWQSLFGGQVDTKTGRAKLPPGASETVPPVAVQPEPEPARPAESEEPVSESNGHAAAEAPRPRWGATAKRLREIVTGLGSAASTEQILEAARADGLAVTEAQTKYAFYAAFPGVRRVGGRRAPEGGPKAAPGSKAKAAAPAPAARPAPAERRRQHRRPGA